MEAKLVKEYGDFYLISNKELQSGDEYVKLNDRPRMLLLGTTIASAKVSKLSLKNCEAIERGYDLDELVKTTFPSLENCGVYLWMSETDRNRQRLAFIKGFRKALEILGDKKFSEEDMMNIYILGGKYKTQKPESFLDKGNEIIQSLQQTEWDVEVEMCIEYTEGGYPVRGDTPKLDAENCLILKRL